MSQENEMYQRKRDEMEEENDQNNYPSDEEYKTKGRARFDRSALHKNPLVLVMWFCLAVAILCTSLELLIDATNLVTNVINHHESNTYQRVCLVKHFDKDNWQEMVTIDVYIEGTGPLKLDYKNVIGKFDDIKGFNSIEKDQTVFIPCLLHGSPVIYQAGMLFDELGFSQYVTLLDRKQGYPESWITRMRYNLIQLFKNALIVILLQVALFFMQCVFPLHLYIWRK